ncbi:MAG: hypothetical protein N4A63_02620 [Vallitalea sp.]|jgi:uncharacterized membrane protein YvbJ|nr:hypothetical protein [Vallitalea sp.]
MSKKICKKCGEINNSSAMFCINCQSSLIDAEIKKDNDEPIIANTSNSNSSIIYTDESETITFGEWMGILIILAIPFINIIALFYLAFGQHNESINNYGKASLVLAGIGLVIVFLFRGCSGI